MLRKINPFKGALGSFFSSVYAELSLAVGGGSPSKPAFPDLKTIKKILLVRLDEIGDFVMTTPLIRELRKNAPQAWISLLVTEQNYPLAEACPYVNEVLNFGPPIPGGWRLLLPPLKSYIFARRILSKKNFDLALVPRWDTDIRRAVFTTYFSGIPIRIGYSEKANPAKALFNRGYDRLLSHALPGEGLLHDVERNLEILRFIGGRIENTRLELWTRGRDETFADDFFKRHNLKSGEVIILCAGAAEAKRMWPLERYVELGKWIETKFRLPLLLIGGPSEAKLCSILQNKIGQGVVNAAGQTHLRRTFALMKRGRMYIGSDTGPMHMAAAAGLPVLEISCHPQKGDPLGTNAPERLGPWTKKSRVLRPSKALSPCGDHCRSKSAHCITQISLDQAKFAVEDLLK